ncbi:YfaZ family outer membrane protein [Shewanella acanthi]|uniref:YfaZ family outer membrane protein n=1 Tax=Shewanella acanthi TaxID=2864212 RepID=UPI001C661ACF|nr:YfaZ family outer membrane protein [Shewanella acanthi]MCH1928827.1 YfaZ family protein [Shewanella shenzhenensis]QYJ77850.1 YfaZ family protein [Shewanella acanthi]
MAKFKLASVLLLGAAALQANATELNVGLNNDVVLTELELQVDKDINGVLGYTYSDDSGHIASGALHMTYDAGVHHFEVGGKLSQLWSFYTPNGSTISVGGRYALTLNQNISLHAAAYFAPSVLSFGDVDGQYELDAKVQYRLKPNMAFYVGYHKIGYDYDHDRYAHEHNFTFEDGVYIGGKFRF